MSRLKRYFWGVAALLLTPVMPVSAQQFSLEADPFPYTVDGYSLHLGHRTAAGKHRAQVGAFAADVPGWLHSNDAVDVRVRAMTVKIDHFFSNETEGFFVGLDSVFGHLEYTVEATGEDETRNQIWVGPRAGYRYHFTDHWYVTPWVSLYYRTNASDFQVGAEQFEEDRVIVLPTVHIGYRFD
jgi:hypothetical protein